MKSEYYSHGKLLITGEYAVLDGAEALAMPTRYGQRLQIKKVRGSDLVWQSLNHDGTKWFSSKISLYDFSALTTTDQKVSDTLQELLKNAVRLNPEFLDKWNGFKAVTTLEFPRLWGLGSSSTLVHLIAQWADVHPLKLYFRTFDGSGYDVACAGADMPIVYYNNDEEVGYTPVDFYPEFADRLYFVYLKEKQDTKAGIEHYLKHAKRRKTLVQRISEITEAVVECTGLQEFSELLTEHEQLLSESLGLETVKNKRFSDYWGCVKSLGAWGGDFVLVTSERSSEETTAYFSRQGYDTVIPFEKMIFNAEKVAVTQ